MGPLLLDWFGAIPYEKEHLFLVAQILINRFSESITKFLTILEIIVNLFRSGPTSQLLGWSGYIS